MHVSSQGQEHPLRGVWQRLPLPARQVLHAAHLVSHHVTSYQWEHLRHQMIKYVAKLDCIYLYCQIDSKNEDQKKLPSPSSSFLFSPSRPGRQCGHPEDAPDVSAEPRVAFPADCASSRLDRKVFKQGKGDLFKLLVLKA